MRSAHSFFAVAVVALISSQLFAAEPARFALLIGNQNYLERVGRLKNPHNDVAIVEAALRRLNFHVTVIKDADYKTMDTAVRRYAAEVQRAGPDAISFFYYSGHGAAKFDTGINYLIPVDVQATDETMWFNSLEQQAIIDRLSKQAANATHYVIFDACRNELQLRGDGRKALTDKGMVPVAQEAGMLIGYSTAPRQTASDEGEGGGLYAKALAEELVRPGFEAVTMFRNVGLRVRRSLKQDPWLAASSSLKEVYLAGMPKSGGQSIVISAPAAYLNANTETITKWIKSLDQETTDGKIAELFGAPSKNVDIEIGGWKVRSPLDAGLGDGKRITKAKLRIYNPGPFVLYIVRTQEGQRLGYGIKLDGSVKSIKTPVPLLDVGYGTSDKNIKWFRNVNDFTLHDLQEHCNGDIQGPYTRSYYYTSPTCYFGRGGSFQNYAFGLDLHQYDNSRCPKDESNLMEFKKAFANISCAAYKKTVPFVAFVSLDPNADPQEWLAAIMMGYIG
ncbi:MAG: caspase domain-containing protein [Rhodomicrobium sp.]